MRSDKVGHKQGGVTIYGRPRLKFQNSWTFTFSFTKATEQNFPLF